MDEALKLENQLCFPLYACARRVIGRYTPYLKPLNLTYTQYIVLLVLWEEKEATVRELCRKLYLDSGTLTPLLKKMESHHEPKAYGHIAVAGKVKVDLKSKAH